MKVVLLPGKGRGILATERICKGEIVFDQNPIAFVPREMVREGESRIALLGVECCKSVAKNTDVWEILRSLCRAELKEPPPYLEVLNNMHENFPETVMFTEDRWIELIGILHLNTFGINGGSAIFAQQVSLRMLFDYLFLLSYESRF